MKKFFILILISGCGKPGNLGEDCKPDGSCNGQLVCKSIGINLMSGSQYYECVLPLPTQYKP